MEPSETEDIIDQWAKNLSALTISKKKDNFQGSLELNPNLFGIIIGRKGSVIKTIQSSTQTKIILPAEGTHVVINGSSERSVKNAYEEISSRIRSLNTHFLSIPIEDESFLNRFSLFKEKVLQKSTQKSRIIDYAFRNPNKLHLTVSTLKLSDGNAIKNCVEKINKFRKENADLFKPMKINFKGVEFWGEDPESTNCLFTKTVEGNDSNNLLSLAFKLEKFLIDEKIIPDNNRHQQNFHLILINKKFVNDNPEIKSFDITEFFDEVMDWDFESFDVQELRLSEKLTGDDVNYYTNYGTWYFDKDDITKK